MSNVCTYLPANGEKTVSVRVHENDLVSVTHIWAVRVDSEDDIAFAVVNGEAIAGEED